MKNLAIIAAVLSVAVNMLAADAFWFAGDGCITDYSKWSNDPRYNNDLWCYFRTATAGSSKTYSVTMSEDMRIKAIFQCEQGLDITWNFYPYTLYFNYADNIRMNNANNTIRLTGGTLSSEKEDKSGYNGSIVIDSDYETLIADGPTAIIDTGINMRGGNFCTTVITNGAKALRCVDIHGYSNNRLIVSGEGSLVNYRGSENFNIGGWHKQGDVIAGTHVVSNNYAHIGNGGVVTNINNVMCGYYGSFGFLDIDGGRLYAKSAIINNSTYASNNTIRIANNSVVAFSDTKYIRMACSDSSVNPITGARLILDHWENDPEKFSGFVIGTTYDWEPNYGSGSSNNVVEIKNGSNITIPHDGKFVVGGGINNGVEISGGSKVIVGADANGDPTSGNGVVIGDQNTSYRNYLKVFGTGTALTNLNTNVGLRVGYRNARDNLLEVSDGAELFSYKGIAIGIDSSYPNSGGHTVRVTRNGRLIGRDGINFGHYMDNGGTVASNRLEVTDGGYADFYRLRFFGQGNEVFVSNGTIRVGMEFYTIYGGEDERGTNTVITFAGDSPRIVIDGDYQRIYRGTIFNFIVPRGGYKTVPYEFAKKDADIVFQQDNNEFNFDISDFCHHGGGKTVLMKSTKGFQISDAQWALLRKNLPPQCSLYLSDNPETLKPAVSGGNLMVLRTPMTTGTVFEVK